MTSGGHVVSCDLESAEGRHNFDPWRRQIDSYFFRLNHNPSAAASVLVRRSRSFGVLRRLGGFCAVHLSVPSSKESFQRFQNAI